MHAALFDIDGTLLDSSGVDDAMYADAIRQVLGPVALREDWSKYPHVTDTGILAEICSDNGLAYHAGVSDTVMDAYLGMLRALTESNGPYAQIPGALKYLNDLLRRPDVRVAYATGGWRATATHKLAQSGFPLDGIPLASANDFHERTRIMQHALALLPGPFESITYFGDGLWDRTAATHLGWHFVPVGLKLGGLTHFNAVPANIPLHRSTSHES